MATVELNQKAKDNLQGKTYGQKFMEYGVIIAKMAN